MNTKAFFLAFITVMIWGSSFPAIQAGLHGGYSAGHLVLSRYLIASAAFAVYAMWPGVKFRLPRKQDLLKIAALGWIGISMYHICVTFGQQSVSAGTAAMIVASTPIFSALIAVFILKERMGLYGWIGLALGFIGIGIITFGTSGASIQNVKGIVLLLLASVATAVLFTFQKSLFSRYSPMELNAYFAWAGTIPFVIFFPRLLSTVQHATLEANFSALYIAIFPTLIGYVTWALALRTGKASSVTSFLYIEPVFSILIAWIWLHELPSYISIIGGTIAIVGVIVVNLLGSKEPSLVKKEHTVKAAS
ncbi:DMT family transporter [Neobacillus mesonae]|uniref:EamA family transporter n=1 Tax=Neobacillus mesonae TaxID=1193713 RepID=A0A3Q9R191_9BACI|nr:DMT family transporter [Neobacillus mesonae]AZU64047.1 EamA family transporter [Neobacillus mesonae]